MTTDQASEDLLIIEDSQVRASTGKRLANYLIDLFFFYFLIFGFGILLAIISPASFDNLTTYNSGNNLLENLFYLILYAVCMSSIEAIFKGKSLGKLITKTRAVNLDGSHISSSTAFARGFSRAVPFCVLSAFGNPCDPWQDRWTKTMVIEEIKR